MPGTRCAVYGCNNTYKKRKEWNEPIIFHRFPKAKDLASQTIRKEWILHSKRENTFNPDTSCICSFHFRENDYERDLQNELLGLPLRKILKKTAVPTLALYKIKAEIKALEKTGTSSSGSREERLSKRSVKEEVSNSRSKLLKTANLQASINIIPDSCQTTLKSLRKESFNEPTLCSSNLIAPDAGLENCMYDKILKYEKLEKQYALLKFNSNIKSKKIEELNEELKPFKNKCYECTPKTSACEKNVAHSAILRIIKNVKSERQKPINWTREEMVTALSLRYNSKKCYLYLKNGLRYPLPGLHH